MLPEINAYVQYKLYKKSKVLVVFDSFVFIFRTKNSDYNFSRFLNGT